MKPTKNRIYCLSCHRTKMLFESKSKADNFIKFNSEEIEELNNHAPKRSYYCSFCLGWHVTSNESEEYAEQLDNRDKWTLEKIHEMEEKKHAKKKNPVGNEKQQESAYQSEEKENHNIQKSFEKLYAAINTGMFDEAELIMSGIGNVLVDWDPMCGKFRTAKITHIKKLENCREWIDTALKGSSLTDLEQEEFLQKLTEKSFYSMLVQLLYNLKVYKLAQTHVEETRRLFEADELCSFKARKYEFNQILKDIKGVKGTAFCDNLCKEMDNMHADFDNQFRERFLKENDKTKEIQSIQQTFSRVIDYCMQANQAFADGEITNCTKLLTSASVNMKQFDEITKQINMINKEIDKLEKGLRKSQNSLKADC